MHHPYLTNNAVQSPSFVSSGNFLPHGREEALGIEEPGHPEHLWSTVEAPPLELTVPLQQLGVPEAECC